MAHNIAVVIDGLMLPDWSSTVVLDDLGNLNIPVMATNFDLQMPDNGVGSDFAEDTFNIRNLAIQTDIHCIPSQESDFALVITCLGNNEYQFAWTCASSECDNRFQPAFDTVNLTLTISQNGTRRAADSWYHAAAYPNPLDSSFTTLVTDFTSLTGPLNNLSSLCAVNGAKGVTQVEVGVPLPPIQGAHCARIMKQVHANITYSRQRKNMNRATVAPGGAWMAHA